MAAISTYTNGQRGHDPRRMQIGEVNPWDFSAPVNPENSASNSRRFVGNGDPSQKFDYNRPPRTPDRNEPLHASGVTQGQLRPEENMDPAYLSPKRGLRPGLNGSRSGSEADSLIDLYGHPRSHGSHGERSVAGSIDKDRSMSHDEQYLDDEDPERSRWIHRDKLAMIETQEMQEAGIKLPVQQAISAPKTKPRKPNASDPDDYPYQETDLVPKKRRVRSPARQDVEGEETLVNDFDLRTPGEIVADSHVGGSSTAHYQPDLRKSSSRIPLPRSSPMPIPQEHIERGTPLPRKRGASGNWTGDESGISYNRMRSRQNSVGSQVLLDDPETSHNTPTPASRPGSQGSPSKTRGPSNGPIHVRKPSLAANTPNTQSKPRTTSNTASPRTPSSNPRPRSRSGIEPRPPTAINRPEGDPPWLATMYKPDPRLPPDQQLLPTHAKRLQQEQWEREQKQMEQRRLDGKASPQLPREFSPLAEHTVNGLQPSSTRQHNDKQMTERGPEWPLAIAPPAQKSIRNAPTPDGSPHGGYSAIPHIRQNASPVNQMPPTEQSLDPFEKERLARVNGEQVKEKQQQEKKDKGCGCCIIM